MNSMRRVRRSARAVLHGPEILQMVLSPEVRAALVRAAEAGAPPATALSDRLMKLAGAKDAKLAPVKQFTGLCVRAVLEEEGFEVASRGVRVSNDPVFRTGTTYEKRKQTDVSPDLMERFVRSLNKAELERLSELITRQRRLI